MVGVHTGIELAALFARLDHPTTVDEAEALLARAIAATVPQFADAPVPEELRPTVARLLRAGGDLNTLDRTPPPPGLVATDACVPGDLAQLALLLVTRTTHAFAGRHRPLAGLPATTLFPVLHEAPRYFAWPAEQRHLGTLHPWITFAASDLGHRVRWRTSAPPRGAGRLLWMCEQMATREHADKLVPQLYKAAREADITNPDWPSGRPPRQCQLDHNDNLTLLRDRTTGTTITDDPATGSPSNPPLAQPSSCGPTTPSSHTTTPINASSATRKHTNLQQSTAPRSSPVEVTTTPTAGVPNTTKSNHDNTDVLPVGNIPSTTLCHIPRHLSQTHVGSLHERVPRARLLCFRVRVPSDTVLLHACYTKRIGV
ncbi:hypothetical protein GCM10029964_056090 [Kibdelosporangium lantanae]